ncbi:MAG: hypothetical protein ACD_57C00376G0001, partial [uncultured bacterium]
LLSKERHRDARWLEDISIDAEGKRAAREQ